MTTINKYHRTIYPNAAGQVDVYDVLVAFEVTCPARQHAIKKLLMAGQRGKGDTMQDLTEAYHAVGRAIDIETNKPKEQA